jgi:hypothetical protein
LKLLVSVVDNDEALEAIEGGADIVDVKNPVEGSLGANFPWVIKEVRRGVSRHVEVSATIGDMPNLPGTAALAALGAAESGADYVKVGLLGPRTCEEATFLMSGLCKAVKDFNPRTRVIAAAYADYGDIGSLSPTALPKVASASGADGVLVDIAAKRDRKLFDYIEEKELNFLVERSHHLGLSVALAGLLGIEDVVRCCHLGADIFGVRKSACEGGDRVKGRVRRGCVRTLSDVIRSLANTSNGMQMLPTSIP